MKNKSTILVPKRPLNLGEFLAVCVLAAKFETINAICRVGRDVRSGDRSIRVSLDDTYSMDEESLSFSIPEGGAQGLPSNVLGMVLVYLGLYQQASLVLPWLSTLELKEAHGANAVATKFNIENNQLPKLDGVLDTIFVDEFNGTIAGRDLDQQTVLFGNMIMIGERLLKMLEAASELDGWVKQHAVLKEVNGISVIWLQDTHPDELNPGQAVNRYVMRKHPEVAISIIPDQKGNGWTIFRFNNHASQVNLNLAHKHPSVSFIHTDGFLLKTHQKESFERLAEIINLTILT